MQKSNITFVIFMQCTKWEILDSYRIVLIHMLCSSYLAPEGVARYCFHPVCLSVCLSVCLCVCVCVRPIFWYFISQLLEEISI